MAGQFVPPTGHVFRVERSRGAVWYAKYRLPDGRQVQKKIGPAWAGRGRPAAGFVTKRLAEDWLRHILDQARRGTLPGAPRVRCPACGVDHAEVIERWLAAFDGSSRTRNKLLIQLHGILGRAKKLYGLWENAADSVEKFPQQRGGDIQVFSPEEAWALFRAADSEQDAAVYLTAAFTGLRMGELLALHWRDVDFAGATVRVRASYAAGVLSTPKSGKVRAVPMAPAVASALAQLGRRVDWVGDDDLVFAGEAGQARANLLRRYRT